MNGLLPNLNELEPYTEEEGTFSHCYFTIPFDELSFKHKLQTINDIVRQTMIYDEFPNPENDTDTLIGDTLTAALASVDYLKQLNFVKDCKYVLFENSKFEPPDKPLSRFAVIVKNFNDEEFYFDATPLVGFGYGKVYNLKKDCPFKNYVEINDNSLKDINKLREILFLSNKGSQNYDDIKLQLDLIDEKNLIECKDLLAKCYKLVSKNLPDKSNLYQEKAQRLNPYINIDDAQKTSKDIVLKAKRDLLLMKQIDIWHNEILGLNKDKTEIIKSPIQQRQIELAQNIVGELKKIDPNLELKIMIDNNSKVASQLSPRWFFENKLNVIMIKPSAYAIDVVDKIKERMSKKTTHTYSTYDANLGEEKPLTLIKPLNFSHSVGLAIERQMTGPSNVFLVDGDLDEIKAEKKKIREEYAGPYYNTEQKWLDGEKILWEKWSTNLVHSTDNPVEASLHFLIGYPEHQIMTRFMYPNPKLSKMQLKNTQKNNLDNLKEKTL